MLGLESRTPRAVGKAPSGVAVLTLWVMAGRHWYLLAGSDRRAAYLLPGVADRQQERKEPAVLRELHNKITCWGVAPRSPHVRQNQAAGFVPAAPKEPSALGPVCEDARSPLSRGGWRRREKFVFRAVIRCTQRRCRGISLHPCTAGSHPRPRTCPALSASVRQAHLGLPQRLAAPRPRLGRFSGRTPAGSPCPVSDAWPPQVRAVSPGRRREDSAVSPLPRRHSQPRRRRPARAAGPLPAIIAPARSQQDLPQTMQRARSAGDEQ